MRRPRPCHTRWQPTYDRVKDAGHMYYEMSIKLRRSYCTLRILNKHVLS